MGLKDQQWNSCWTLRLAQGRLASGAFSALWVYCKVFRRYFKRTGRSLFFRHSFLANFVGFIVFSFTLGHNFPLLARASCSCPYYQNSLIFYCSSFIYCKHERDARASRRKCFLARLTFIYWLLCKVKKICYHKKKRLFTKSLVFFIKRTKRSIHSKPLPISANIRALLNQISRELQKYNHQLELFRLHHHQNPYC